MGDYVNGFVGVEFQRFLLLELKDFFVFGIFGF